MQIYDQPDARGHFGPYGGVFVAETLMAALDALKQQGLPPATNIKILLDSEEEKGSPTLGQVIQ